MTQLDSMHEAAPTSKALAPPPGHPHFPLFDSLRGIAVLMVVLGHATFFAGAEKNEYYGPLLAHTNLALVIFFIVSGFLLYRPMCAERFGGPKSPRVRDYGRRRFLRIAPGYWVAFTLLLIYPGLLVGEIKDTWWAFYGLIQIYPIWDGPDRCFTAYQDCGIASAWSLSSEVAFYAALPLLMYMGRLLGKGRSVRTALSLELGVLAVLGLGAVWVQTYSLNSTHSWLSLSLATTFTWFAAGMALALASAVLGRRQLKSWLVHPELCWGLAVVLYVVLAYPILPEYPDLGTRPEEWADRLGLCLVAVLLVVPAIFSDKRPGPVTWLLSRKWLLWIGLISYGIFLYHVSVSLQLAQKGWVDWIPGGPAFALTAGTLMVSIPLGALSYYLVERPFLRFK